MARKKLLTEMPACNAIRKEPRLPEHIRFTSGVYGITYSLIRKLRDALIFATDIRELTMLSTSTRVSVTR